VDADRGFHPSALLHVRIHNWFTRTLPGVRRGKLLELPLP
jgi:hypothetical protein